MGERYFAYSDAVDAGKGKALVEEGEVAFALGVCFDVYVRHL